jgi:hypothetical protein
VEVHPSARRHGVQDDDIRHAADHVVVVVDLDPDGDPPARPAGNMLKVIVLSLSGDRTLAVHAMRPRQKYYDLLPRGERSDD